MHVSLQIAQNRRFTHKHALMIYRDGNESFVTLHEIRDGVPGPAQPLTVDFVAELTKGLFRNAGPEIFPEAVLARTADMFAWWTPAQTRTMFFAAADGKMSDLNGLIFPQPALVWRVRGGSLSVRALKQDRRPIGSTALHVAPFWNVYENGSVCLGSTVTPQRGEVSSYREWESAFYSSAFTHPIGAQRLTTLKGGFHSMWSALAGKEQFPARYLVDAKQTLANFVGESDD